MSWYLAQMRDVKVVVDGGRINVWRREAEPGEQSVVLIHGLTGTSRWWTPVISHLPSRQGFLAFDVRGRGQSSECPGPFALTTTSDDIVACLDEFEIESAAVAGYSMGAWVAAAFAARHRHRTTRLTLVDGGLPLELSETDSTDEMIGRTIGPALERLGMVFDSQESYCQFWRDHPAMNEQWPTALDGVFAYEIKKDPGGYRVRSNAEAISVSARDFVSGIEVNGAHLEVDVPTSLVTVDHGLLGQPGGFISQAAADKAAQSNPNITSVHLKNLNHYTLMLGSGAARVAAILAMEGSETQ